jgi:hypothetical protein
VISHRTVARWSVDVDRIARARVLNAWTRKHLARVAHQGRDLLMERGQGVVLGQDHRAFGMDVLLSVRTQPPRP